MEKLSWTHLFVFVAAVLTAAADDFHTCQRNYQKLGCFHQGKVKKLTQLFSDRDGQGHELNWKKFKESIHSIACRCAEEAKSRGFSYFAIRYWALCLAGNDFDDLANVYINPKTRSSNCVNHVFKKCNHQDKYECVGKDNADYLYLIPGLKGKWSKCSKSCGNDGTQDRSLGCKLRQKGQPPECEAAQRSCNLKPCWDIGKLITFWSGWTKCKMANGDCSKSRKADCTMPRSRKRSSIICRIDGKTEENKKCPGEQCVAKCVKTSGGNSKGACCKFPFIYRNKKYTACTSVRHTGLWCATKSDYAKHRLWGNCPAKCVKTSGGNSKGACCKFPFIYKNKKYTACTSSRLTGLWCATKSDYAKHRLWGKCPGNKSR